MGVFVYVLGKVVAANFVVAVLCVEFLGGDLEDGGVEVEGVVAEGTGTGFELVEDELAVTSALILG